jgi:hypothetical protein
MTPNGVSNEISVSVEQGVLLLARAQTGHGVLMRTALHMGLENRYQERKVVLFLLLVLTKPFQDADLRRLFGQRDSATRRRSHLPFRVTCSWCQARRSNAFGG